MWLNNRRVQRDYMQQKIEKANAATAFTDLFKAPSHHNILNSTNSLTGAAPVRTGSVRRGPQPGQLQIQGSRPLLASPLSSPSVLSPGSGYPQMQPQVGQVAVVVKQSMPNLYN